MERVRKQQRVPRSRLVQQAVGDYMQRTLDEALHEARIDGGKTVDGDDPEFTAIERVAIEDLRKALRRARGH